MRLSYGSATVLQGVAVGLALVAVVAAITFLNHHRLPYRRMLVVTGAMLGVVLVVMVGEQVQEMQQAGWIGTTTIGVAFPNWLGTWFATFATVEGLVAQAIAGGVVIGSYLIASEVQVRRPARHGTRPATRLARGAPDGRGNRAQSRLTTVPAPARGSRIARRNLPASRRASHGQGDLPVPVPRRPGPRRTCVAGG